MLFGLSQRSRSSFGVLSALCSITFLGAVGASAASSYTYRFEQAITGQTCAQAAQQIAARFQKATSVAATGQCQGTTTVPGANAKKYVVIVTTDGAKRFAPHDTTIGSTSDLGVSAPLAVTQIYKGYEACLSDVSTQAAAFEQSTGLVAVATSCHADSLNTGYFQLSITSFGSSERQLMVLNAFNGVGDSTSTAKVAALLQSEDARIIKTVGSMFLFYARPYQIHARTNSFGLFRNADICRAQVAEALAILNKAGAKQSIVTCDTGSSNFGVDTALDTVSDVTAFLSSDYGSHSAVYGSLDECLLDRPRVLAQSGEHVLGGICEATTGPEGSFNLVLYTDR